MIKKGDRVLYALTARDAEQINRRRTTGPEIAARMQQSVCVNAVVGKEHEPRPELRQLSRIFGWPAGAQAHIGNPARVGMTFPGVVVEDWAAESQVAGIEAKPNLQVWLDGTDTLWVASAPEGDGPGTFTRQH